MNDTFDKERAFTFSIRKYQIEYIKKYSYL